MSKTYKDKPIVKQELRWIKWIKSEDKPRNPKLISEPNQPVRYKNWWWEKKWSNQVYQKMQDLINSLK